jgi:hypothetical protein
MVRMAYAERVQTRYEHAREIRDLPGFRDFTDETGAEVTAFVASRADRQGDAGRRVTTEPEPVSREVSRPGAGRGRRG